MIISAVTAITRDSRNQMRVAVSAARDMQLAYQPTKSPTRWRHPLPGNRGECCSQPCSLKIPYHYTLHFLRRDFSNNGVEVDYNSGWLYTYALICIHFCKVAIPPARADARGIGNGFGIISSQHGAIDETLDVLRIRLQPWCHTSAPAITTLRNHVVTLTFVRLLH